MRRTLLIIVLFVTTYSINAQTTNYSSADSLPKAYLGFGTGMNSYTGMAGVSANLRVYKKIFLQGGLGIGSWGSRASIGLRYDMSYQKGWSYGIGFSTNSGLTDYKTKLELESGKTEEVTMDCLRASTVNLKATYYWKIGRKSNIYLDCGYAIPLQSSPWKIKDGKILSSTSKSVMEMVAPGGLLIGVGILFGL